tara:strand:+ start:33770 stop:35380 length:1611 start_codon:yes stop_codon:yes gene_type:complete
LKKIQFLFLSILIASFSSCAKKGRPTGGPKDLDAPIFVTANPPYKTVNFDKNEIKIYFDEYIKLKEVNKQLVISPPLNPSNPSLITPQGSASKYISIKLLDTLLKNTTYTFDFGNSIEDNNESNKLERFKYVFSTGPYIDSLSLRGSVKNAYSSEKIKDIKLLLYKLDSAFTDSIIYKEKPNYVTTTLDSSVYKFTNLKEGKYLLIALKDAASDYIFDPKNDEIGFYRDTITLPRDSVIETPISIFKEKLPFSFKKAKELKKGQLIFAYEGIPTNLKADVLSNVPEDFKSITSFEKDKDTLNFWHSPIEKDSLVFKLTKGQFIDTVVVNLRKEKLDSLIVTSSIGRIINHTDTLFLETNNPITKIDTSKVSFINIDSLKVPFSPFISKNENKVGFLFNKKFNDNYNLKIDPGAFTDIFDQVNDSLKIEFNTRSIESYGDITISVINPNTTSVIIQITDTKDNTINQQVVEATKTISFKYLIPKEYKIRVIYDTNKNGKWDTGNYLKRQKAEAVEYYKDIFKIRAFFSINETITIKQ